MLTTLSTLIATMVCLAFTTTRAVGIVGLFLLLNTNPLTTVTAILVGCLAFYIYQKHTRSK